MNGMLRDLFNERVDAAGGPDLDLHDLIAQGERTHQPPSSRGPGRHGGCCGAHGGCELRTRPGRRRRTSPPVGPTTNSPTTADVKPDPADTSRPLTYGLGATIHYGDRVIEAAEDPDGLFVFDDGLWFFTGDEGATK